MFRLLSQGFDFWQCLFSTPVNTREVGYYSSAVRTDSSYFTVVIDILPVISQMTTPLPLCFAKGVSGLKSTLFSAKSNKNDIFRVFHLEIICLKLLPFFSVANPKLVWQRRGLKPLFSLPIPTKTVFFVTGFWGFGHRSKRKSSRPIRKKLWILWRTQECCVILKILKW